MAKPKGSTKSGGRQAGVPNKVTTQAREAIAAFVEGNVDRLNNWLDMIAEKDAKDAFNCFMSVVEYHIPKLARQEVTGKDGEPIEVKNVSDNDKSIIERFFNQKKDKK